jgi:hypothetical protein
LEKGSRRPLVSNAARRAPFRDNECEARDNAARIEDPKGKRLMLEIATTYDQLAKES